jgi:hypothetical protein
MGEVAQEQAEADTEEDGPRRRLWPAWVCLLLALLAVAWVAGRQSVEGDPGPRPSLDAVRLGPDPGVSVPGYLAELPARLPPSGGAAVPALVQFVDGQDEASAARLLGAADTPAGGAPPGGRAAPVTPVRAVFRVPLPRVQTALRFEPLPPVDDADPVAGVQRRFVLARRAAQRDAAAEAGRLSGRAAALARYEAAALTLPAGGAAAAGPGCRCLLAVLVTGDRAGLTRLAAQPRVRAVDAAPEGTPPAGVALSPLLPEQTRVAAPVPDDGPVPPTGG